MAKGDFASRYLISGLMLLAVTGCQLEAQTIRPLVQLDRRDVSLTIEAEVGQEGEVTIAGRTNLPNNTQLTGLALRTLTPAQPVAVNAPPTYAILAYQTTTVQNGQWQIDLNLWQVAADGLYQEAWQRQAASLDLKLQPEEMIRFVITLAPREFLSTMNRNFQPVGFQLPANLVRTTHAGETLLWAEASLPVELPQGRTTPPVDLATYQNGGWGERYRLVPEPPLPYTLTPDNLRETSAAPSPDEFLR